MAETRPYTMILAPVIVLDLLFKYGPTAVIYAQQIAKWIEDKKENVTSADIAELIAYGEQKGADYFKIPAPPTPDAVNS